ncbi:MAG: hypothetical protein ACUVXA_11530 [Candidatus Jordarchaeum sp.]|uniref:hypothetical protein n=1 Tax=Candidatus Jordarchaeum sp. TaxID=2823881 RepID=UPI00404AEB25
MIHGIYIIEACSGVCLISRKYGDVELDEGLISGFLTALQQFSSELASQKGQPAILREVEMKNYAIVYERTEDIMVVASVDKRDNEKVLRNALNKIIEMFLQRYDYYLKSWRGDIKPFREFLPEIDKLTLDGKIAELAVPKPLLKKKIPKSVVKMGVFLDEDAFTVANLCDGTKTKEEISEETGFTIEKVGELLEQLEKMGLIEM